MMFIQDTNSNTGIIKQREKIMGTNPRWRRAQGEIFPRQRRTGRGCERGQERGIWPHPRPASLSSLTIGPGANCQTFMFDHHFLSTILLNYYFIQTHKKSNQIQK